MSTTSGTTIRPPRLAFELAQAWADKARAAEARLQTAAAAPLFFTPQWVERETAELQKALRWAQFWLGQAATA